VRSADLQGGQTGLDLDDRVGVIESVHQDNVQSITQ
jgi:hypothetical protein